MIESLSIRPGPFTQPDEGPPDAISPQGSTASDSSPVSPNTHLIWEGLIFSNELLLEISRSTTAPN